MGPLKIKLNVPKSVVDYFRLQQVWENEGGAISALSNTSPGDDVNLPLQPGTTFKVVSGQFEVEDDTLYYIAEITSL